MTPLQIHLFVLLVGVPFSPQPARDTTAPHFSNALNQQAPPSPPAKKSPSHPQKISNPLNDLLDEAQQALDKNNFEAAIPPLQKFLAEKPDVPFAHFQLAYTYTALKRPDEAQAEYERAIPSIPKCPK